MVSPLEAIVRGWGTSFWGSSGRSSKEDDACDDQKERQCEQEGLRANSYPDDEHVMEPEEKFNDCDRHKHEADAEANQEESRFSPGHRVHVTAIGAISPSEFD